MTTAAPLQQGFLVVLADPARTRGWPDGERSRASKVWFHGYVADPAHVRADLGLDRLATTAQILSAAYTLWGAGVIERVTGEYAAVLVTGDDAVVIGDRMGLRPVYIADRTTDIVISTDLGLLACETTAWRDVDEEYVADSLATGFHLGTRTPYRDIRRLGLGEHATWRAGVLKVAGGWRPRTDTVDGTAREHEGLLRTAVGQAVAGALPPNTGVAVELSGGLDTSTVLAAAAQHAPVHAVSFVHPGAPDSDESAWMRVALETTPAPWHPIDATTHGIFTAGPDFGVFLPAPTRRILNWASSAAEDAVLARLDVSTVLTGEGGDAVFLAGVLPWYLADLLRTGRWPQLRRELLRWSTDSEVRRSAGFWLRRAAVDGLRRWRQGSTLTLQLPKPLESSAPWLNRDYISDRHLQDRTRTTTPLRTESVHTQAVLENIVRCAEFARSRQVIPAGPADVRHPLLTPALVDLALGTPWQVATDPRIDRAVQRYAFAGSVADAVLRRRSKTIADEAVLNGFATNPRWQTYLREEPLVVQRGYVDAAAWDAELSAVGGARPVAQLYAAIQIEVWLRHLKHANPPVLLT